MRYGSAPVVAFAIGLALIMWWRAALRAWPQVLAMIASICVLIVPHLIRSHEVTGSYLGILQVSRGMPRREYIGEGLVTYLTSNPFVFYGVLVAPVMVAGLVGLAGARGRAPFYLAICALAQITFLGLQSHGQPRYVFIATALLVVVGVDYLRNRFPRPFPRVALGLVVAAQLTLVVISVFYYRAMDDARAPIVEAAAVIQADAGGRPCAAVAKVVPQLMWHSRCFVEASELVKAPLPVERERYAVWFSKWPMDLDAFLAAQKLRAEPVPTGDPRTRVWRLR
jgi:hypothetical protein